MKQISGPEEQTVLHGWKEIAEYVSRDVRTVRRWEHQRGFPVRRTPGQGRANVFAFVLELDRWLNSTPPADDSKTGSQMNALPLEALLLEAPVEVGSASPAPAKRFHLALAGVALGLVALLVAIFALRAHRVIATTVVAARVKPHSSSPVEGVDSLNLQALYFYEHHTPDSLQLAQGLFMKASSEDPGSATAWAGLANTQITLCEYGMCDRPRDFGVVRDAATHALALDPTLADAHSALGFADFFYFLTPKAAEQEFRKALASDPDSALTHHRYGLMLMTQSHFPEALAQLETAQKLDPTSTTIVSDRALAFGLSGHRDEAVQTLLPVAQQQPDNPMLHHALAMLYKMAPSNELAVLKEGRTLHVLLHTPKLAAQTDREIHVYQRQGEKAMWRDSLTYLTRSGSPVDYLDTAVAQEALGEHALALNTLDLAVRNPDRSAIALGYDPGFQALHGNPRFEALLALMSLPPSSPKN